MYHFTLQEVTAIVASDVELLYDESRSENIMQATRVLPLIQ